VAAMRALRAEGADVVAVTRAERPTLLLEGDVVQEVVAPRLDVVDPSGAGDAFVGAFASVLARDGTVVEAVMLGAAAGAQNVTRHGLGTGDADTIERLRERVVVRPVSDERDPDPAPAREVTPDELARGIEDARS